MRKDVKEQSEAEKALRKSEARFRAVFEQAGVGIAVANAAGRIVENNAVLQAMLGYTKDELRSLTFKDFTHADDIAADLELFQELLSGKRQYYKLEKRYVRKDGKIIWGRLTISAIPGASPEEQFSIGIVENITAHKRALESLRRSEERFRRIFEKGPVGMALVGADYRFFKVNQELCRILGYRPEELVQLRFVDVTHPDDLEKEVDLAERMFKGEIPCYQLEKRYLTKQGTVVWGNLTATLIRDREGKPLYGVEMVEDITKRKQVEEKLAELMAELRKSHDNLLSILDQLEVGTVMIDGRGCVKFLSKAAQRLFSTAPEQAVKMRWDELLPFSESDRVRVQSMLECAPQRRSRIGVHAEVSPGQHYWMDMEVQDDPRDPQTRILFFYDTTALHDLRHLLQEKARFEDLVGKSRSMRVVYQQIREVCAVDSTVLIEGETGTGKELVARAIHEHSRRRERPFVTVNCGALSESLIESRLFGHRRGSFTGAIADHQGLFEVADGGTIFLDEIGDIPLLVQTNLLRVLETREITRVGESRPRKIDVRILAATHRDLNEEVAFGRFRQDLLYRIRVVTINLPPLRDRLEDVPLLVAEFLRQASAAMGKVVQHVSHGAMGFLLQYPWPGNVRELKNAVEFAVIRCKGHFIEPQDLPRELTGRATAGLRTRPARDRLLAVLESTAGNRAAAARLLGISRSTFYRRLKSLKTVASVE